MIDFLYENVNDTLKAYSANLPADRQFNVIADFFRTVSIDSVQENERNAYVYFDSIEGVESKSASRGKYYGFRERINIDLVVSVPAFRNVDGSIDFSDRRTMVALRSFVADIYEALYNYQGVDFGSDTGDAGNRPFADLTVYVPDESPRGKSVIAGARLELDYTRGYEPGKLDPGELLELNVDATGDNAFSVQEQP